MAITQEVHVCAEVTPKTRKAEVESGGLNLGQEYSVSGRNRLCDRQGATIGRRSRTGLTQNCQARRH